MKAVILELNWLDLFFIGTTLVSLAWNIVQYVERRKSRIPMKSSLIALFNDIKGKTLHAYQIQNMIFADTNPHKDVDTLKWDYASFAQSVISDLQGFQEIVVGLLVSLDVTDRDGREAFRAGNYGLTPEEQELRRRATATYYHSGDMPTRVQNESDDQRVSTELHEKRNG